ncbi:hypothetical protein B0T20DRAFT_65191 [Sordaria brevicollis]|uniref:Uncharacterized protein n=1 Tax=Sordaria brevicollis TaxID=83679 RepID=A0AAE0P1Z4_SORBR|nr:hypothetical protein B0T20DRAFT_65191 [Sordaria brevicollis]
MGSKHYPPNASQVAASPGRFALLPAPPISTVGLSTTSSSWASDGGSRRHHSFDTPRKGIPSSPTSSSTKKPSLVKRAFKYFNSSTNLQLYMRSDSRHDDRNYEVDNGTSGAFYDLTESKNDTLMMVSTITTDPKSTGPVLLHKRLPLTPPARAPTAPPMFGAFETVRSIPVDEDTSRNGMSLDLSLFSSTVSRPVLLPRISDTPSLGSRGLGNDDPPTETSPPPSLSRSSAAQLQESQGKDHTIVSTGVIRVLDQAYPQPPQYHQQNQFRSQSVPHTGFPLTAPPGQNPPGYHHANKRSSLLPPSSATSSPASVSSTYASNDILKRKKLPPSQPSERRLHQQPQPQQNHEQQSQPQQQSQQRPPHSRRQSQQSPVLQEMDNLNIMLESQLISERQKNEELQKRIDDLYDLLNEQNQRQESANHGAGAAAGNYLQGSEVRQRWKTLGWKIRQFIHAVSSQAGSVPDGGHGPDQSCDGDDGDDTRDGNGSRWQQLSSEQAVLGRQQHSSNRSGMQSSKTSATNVNEILRSITPHYRTLLAMKDMDGRQLLAEAVIWSLLVKEIFGTKEMTSWMHWAGTLSSNLRVMVAEAFQHGTQNSKEFHRWRCHTASYLATLPNEADVHTHAELVVQKLEHVVWYTLTGGGSAASNKPKTSRSTKTNNFNNLRSGLLEIVLSAIQFDKELCQQRAFWYCQYPAATSPPKDNNDGGVIRFEPQTMEALNGDSKSVGPTAVVTLMVSPMLVKAGDAYGDGYDRPEVIEKSVVHVVSKYWEDNGYSNSCENVHSPSPSQSQSQSPMSSSLASTSREHRGTRSRGMSTAPETGTSGSSAMVVYRAPSSRNRYVSSSSRPASWEKSKDGSGTSKGKGKKWLGGLKRRTAFNKGARSSEFYDGS